MSSYNKYNTKSKKYKHLSDFERGQIKILLDEDYSLRQISQKLNRNVSTISRELKRNEVTQVKLTSSKNKKYFNVYSPESASISYLLRRKKCVKKDKFSNQFFLKEKIEYYIKELKYSPEIISYILKQKGVNICFKTIYNYADSKKLDLTKLDFRFRARRKYKIILDNKDDTKFIIPEEKRIDNRPKKINSKEEFGHWEGDLIIGVNKSNSQHLLTLVERKTLATIILKVNGKCQSSITSAIDKLEKYYFNNFKKIFKSITFDNGIEFRNYKLLEKSIINNSKRTTIYYGRPYKSNDRALNENTNGLVRIHFNKGTNFNNISEGKIKEIENWLNTRPRKTLGFNKSINLFYEQLKSITV